MFSSLCTLRHLICMYKVQELCIICVHIHFFTSVFTLAPIMLCGREREPLFTFLHNINFILLFQQ